MTITRRLALTAGLGTALSALSLSALRADGPVLDAIDGAEDF